MFCSTDLPQSVREVTAVLPRATLARPLESDASVFLTPRMEEDFRTAPEGGRFFRLLTRIAINAISNGYPIEIGSLPLLRGTSTGLPQGKSREGVLREDQRALAFAVSSVQVPNRYEQRYAHHLRRLKRGR